MKPRLFDCQFSDFNATFFPTADELFTNWLHERENLPWQVSVNQNHENTHFFFCVGAVTSCSPQNCCWSWQNWSRMSEWRRSAVGGKRWLKNSGNYTARRERSYTTNTRKRWKLFWKWVKFLSCPLHFSTTDNNARSCKLHENLLFRCRNCRRKTGRNMRRYKLRRSASPRKKRPLQAKVQQWRPQHPPRARRNQPPLYVSSKNSFFFLKNVCLDVEISFGFSATILFSVGSFWEGKWLRGLEEKLEIFGGYGCV